MESELKSIHALERMTWGWLANGTETRVAMQEYLETCRKLHRAGPWPKLLKLNWGIDRAGLCHRLQDDLVAEPLPKRALGLWFTVPSIDLNDTTMLWLAVDDYDATGKSSEWLTDTIWPRSMKPSYKGAPRMFMLNALQEVRELFRCWKHEGASDAEVAAYFAYTLPIGYVTALLADVLPMISPKLLLHHATRRGVSCGYWGGDWSTLGWLTPIGWATRKKSL